jgi:hypothetical protein
MLDSSDPPSTPLLLDLSLDIGSLPVVRLPADPLPEFGTSVVLMGIFKCGNIEFINRCLCCILVIAYFNFP